MPVAGLIIGGASLIEGGIQAYTGAQKAKRAREALNNLKSPAYAPNKAINDYYQMALNRYNAGPYNSLQFQQAQKGLNTGLATGINALQGRRAGVGGIGGLVGQYQSGITGAGVAAQRQQTQDFSQLGGATNMQLNDSRFAFQQNQEAPYNRALQYNYAMLGGGNQMVSAGLSNVNSGLSTGAMAGQQVYNAANPGDKFSSNNMGGYYNNGGGNPYMRSAFGY